MKPRWSAPTTWLRFPVDHAFASTRRAHSEVASLAPLGRFSIANLSHRVDGESRVRRYGMVLQTRSTSNASRLADSLDAMDTVLEFRIAPTGD